MAPCTITLGDVFRSLVLFSLVATGVLGGAYATFGEELEATAAPIVPAEDPVTIKHSDGEEVVITSVSGEDLSEDRMIRLATKTIAVAPPGSWIARIGNRFTIWTVSGEAGELVDDTNPKPAETQLAKVPEDLATENPAQGATVWFLTKAEDGSCPPCDLWEGQDLPKLKEAGVTVHTVRRPAHNQPTPTFILAAVGKSPVQRTGRWDNWTDAEGILEFLGL